MVNNPSAQVVQSEHTLQLINSMYMQLQLLLTLWKIIYMLELEFPGIRGRDRLENAAFRACEYSSGQGQLMELISVRL